MRAALGEQSCTRRRYVFLQKWQPNLFATRHTKRASQMSNVGCDGTASSVIRSAPLVSAAGSRMPWAA